MQSRNLRYSDVMQQYSGLPAPTSSTEIKLARAQATADLESRVEEDPGNPAAVMSILFNSIAAYLAIVDGNYRGAATSAVIGTFCGILGLIEHKIEHKLGDITPQELYGRIKRRMGME